MERKKKEGEESVFIKQNELFSIHEHGQYKNENSPHKTSYTCHFYWENVRKELDTENRNISLSIIDYIKNEGEQVNHDDIILEIGFDEAKNEFGEYDKSYDKASIKSNKSGYLNIPERINESWIFDGEELFTIYDKQEYEQLINRKQKDLRKRKIEKLDYVINRQILTTDSNTNLDNAKCFVYLMVDTTNNFHKIGISSEPKYREKTLQSEKPTIELIAAKEYPNRKTAASIETELHNIFEKQRIRGEWFKLSEKDINDIKMKLK